MLKSLSIVPVGLTKHRKGLMVKKVSIKNMREFISHIEKYLKFIKARIIHLYCYLMNGI